MADKAISELIAANQVTPTDLFVLEQSGTAKKLTGQTLENWLVSFADGHGGIQTIAKHATEGLVDTYRITLADTTTFDFVVNNGKGISGITKTATEGLVDTYTIQFNDSTSATFTVTNGEKGDKGDNQFIWIKYASQKPTASSHSFGDVADNWIGVYSGDSATAPTDWQQYTWFEIKGAKGDQGEAATLTSSKVEYQVSDSGSIIPSGAWSESVPVVPQGKYLWSRTTNTFNTGSPVVTHSVSRMGLDGTGSVSSVANISPDTNGNVPLTAEHIGAVPSGGGDMTGELRMNGQPISGLNMPTANDQAANMGFVNQQVKKAAPRNLLDNSDFRNPVNQRGFTESHNDCYTIDRWFMYVDQSDDPATFVRISDGGIQMNAENNELNFYQVLPNHDDLVGKLCTVAVNVDGTVYAKTFWFSQQTAPLHFGDTQLKFYSVPGMSALFRITSDVEVRYNLYWVAIYEGEYTAETLPEYQPKGYGVELAECMRYYYRNYYGEMPQAGFASLYAPVSGRTISVMFPTPMRVTPTITLYNPVTGHSGCVADWATDADVIASAIYSTEHNFILGGDMTEGQMIAYNYEASADL